MSMKKTNKETVGFQAEVKQLLHLMVHSLYSNKEIFLRELISNASDANDKLRFQALGQEDLLEDSPELHISVSVDKGQRLLCVTDNGIGMSRAEITQQLGTIAHSGTTEFLESLSGDQQKDSQLIGQFGVGFYSSFIVAQEVEVVSRKAGLPKSEGVRWTSKGDGEFTVESIVRADRGTSVILKLKADEDEFLDGNRVRNLIREYADHISFPVQMASENDEEGEQQTVNRAKALWTRPRAEIKDDEYVEFYKYISRDLTDPLVWAHNKVEGKREYTSLLYIPAAAPFDLWNREVPRGVKLYIQRVFITDEATQFLPLYLRFVRGIVDSSDLSLNISREMLQQDPNVSAIKTALTKRVLDVLKRLATKEVEKYRSFWEQFGLVLKEGLAEDFNNREKIAGLLRFNTTMSEGVIQDRSLENYISDSGEKDIIYYICADSASSIRANPHLEIFDDKGVEVLLLSDRIDEWVMQHLPEYKGKSFRDIARGDLDLIGKADAETKTQTSKEQKHFLKRVKRVLRDKVDEVRISYRLKESAACLVLGDQDLGYQMQKLLKATGSEAPESVPSLELNPSHPLVQRLEGEINEEKFDSLAVLLLEEAIIAEGRQLDEPAAFVKRLNQLLINSGDADTQDVD